MNREQLNDTKQQLWDYYRYLDDLKGRWTQYYINFFHQRREYVPSGLVDSISYTYDEIQQWKKVQPVEKVK
jgi:hypothetical protein